MGMRKGRSGESPHGKNCGMKSRLAGAVRCLVHACLTAAANVGALCMRGWRWMLGAFARTRTSAKRTLTNIEGVLVTLALIATLGIASPLAAGAIEPVEDPTPVSGVLDADGAQIADAADSDDVTDESDVADSDETAKDDASADQDATEGDAADEATEDADADADASEKDASTDGERSEDASSAAAEGAVSGEGSKTEKERDDDAGNSTKRASNAQGRANEPMEIKTFTDYLAASPNGGNYNRLGQILSNYNVFVSNNYYGTHVVGAMAVGGTAQGKDTPWGELAVGGGQTESGKNYQHQVPSWFKNIANSNGKGISNIITNNDSLPLLTGSTAEQVKSYQKITEDDYNAAYKDENGKIVEAKTSYYAGRTAFLTNDWIDFDSVMEDINKQTTALIDNASSPITITSQSNGKDEDPSFFMEENGVKIEVPLHENKKTPVLQAGRTYIIDDYDTLERLKNVTIQIPTTDPVEIHQMQDTVIAYSKGNGSTGQLCSIVEDPIPNEKNDSNVLNKNCDALLPGVHFITSEGRDFTPGTDEAPQDGIPLMFAYPNVQGIIRKHPSGQGTLYGHVIAPYASIYANMGSGNFNGTYIAKNALMNCEGHMWPYNGTWLAVNTPDQFIIKAKKTMIGRGLQNGEFSFALWNADDKWEQTGNQPIQTKQNQANGSIAFDAIPVTKNDVHIWGTWLADIIKDVLNGSSNRRYEEKKTLRYLIREIKPNTADGAITYDETVYRVAVEATLTADFSHNLLNPDTTISVTTPVYTRVNADGTTESLGNAKPEFVNTVKTTKLTVTKKMAEEGDTADGKSFGFNIYLSLPEGTALKPAGSADTTEPTKLFFDNRTDPARDTFAYACEPNAAKTGCQISNGTASKQEFYIPAGTQIALPNDEPGKYADKFDVKVEKVRENGKETNRSTVKLERKPGHENEPVPQEIAWPQLVVGTPGASGTVSCPGDQNKTCTKIATSIAVGSRWTSPDLPVGTYYYVEEPVSAIPGGFALEGYECSTNARAASTQPCSGTLQVNANGNPVQVSIVVTNKRTTVPLSIMKIVDNWQDVPQGNDQDTTFGFSVSLYDKKGNALSGPYVYKVYDENNSPVQNNAGGTLNCSTTNGSTVGTCGTLELKHNQKAVIEGLPYGTRFVVKEQTPKDPFKWDSQEVTGISSTSGCKDSDENGKCAVTSDGVLVTVHNRYELRVVLPETGGKAHPFMTMLFGVGVVCAGLLITAIYMRRQGMAMLQ